RSGSLWFFIPSNPTITFGGFIGESKSEIYQQLPPGSFPKSILVQSSLSRVEVEARFITAAFTFPVAVKPDVGMMGYMFRKVNSMRQLLQYHDAMESPYLIQRLITYPLEVSIFYFRHPNAAKGNITGFVKKEFMKVTGDGQSTLRELIMNYPRASFKRRELLSKHESKLNTIIPAGETYILSYALNLSRGGKLVSLENKKDNQLLNVFDSLSHFTKTFYYGRFDIRCRSIEDLKNGKNYSILEYNGCGAEPHHIYGNGYSFLEACMTLIQHWKILRQISMYNYRHGVPRWGFWRGLRFTLNARRYFRKLRALDSTFEFRNHSPAESYSLGFRASEYVGEGIVTQEAAT
ncbi:MAG TPA: hypothetical protein VFW11_04020, partial [Cyclobacteriaceae bacterium]|nr:hypothetical protein [Cyclobacteriaceae bacterium]